ncbi:hypothetical protein [Actinoplanes regularis]|uniref:hypothetical protein n=1 Tax=Actinoplanes regularis TaxID=52697 RepID=UPI000B76C98A|nr:hypothetical protein [Actinoplanes regularis]GIE89062.1 hypothetical protein Are01nite_55420 [Actinoplanes regularis]
MQTSLPDVPRWAVLAAHGAALTVVPSGIWRILSAVAHVPLNTTATAARHDNLELITGWWYPIALTVVSELLAYLTVGLVAPWGEMIPRWVPWLGGRRIRIAAAVLPAGIGATVLTLLWTYSLSMIAAGRSIEGSVNTGLHMNAWQQLAFWTCYGPLVLWGPLLGAVTIHYYRRRRRTVRCGNDQSHRSAPDRPAQS